MKRNKRKIQFIISSSFAFFLTLLITALYLCLGFGFGVFSNSSITSKLNESNYYNEIYQEIKKDTEDIVSKAGLPVNILEDVITFDRVYVGGKNYIGNALEGQKSDIKIDKLHSQLTDNIETYLTEENIIRTDDLATELNELVTVIEDKYKSGIEFKFADYIAQYRSDHFNLMKIIAPIIIALIVILCYFLIRMHRHKHRGIRYITYGLISSSFITILSAAYLLISKKYVKSDISPQYYRNFVNAYIKWDIMIFIYMGIIGLIIAATLISLTKYLKNNK